MKLEIDDLGVCGVIVDDWAIEKSFKPKTITTDYNSWICYISRRAVPANTPITDTYYWKPLTRLQSQLAFNYETFKAYVESRLKTMDLEIESFLKSVSGGTAITDQFGNSELVAVNQKVHTAAINKIYEILEDITGNIYHGINMVVTPEYFIGEDGATVSITANTTNTNGIFEFIEFYINGSLIAKDENVDYFTYNTIINETSVVKCIAKILGVEYTREKLITHYNSFWLGAGTTYSDVMDVKHVIPITNGMRGTHNVNVAQGQHIIIVVGDSLASGFIRADLNSIEINFIESTITIDNKTYKVFTSEEVYSAGTYNIDING